MRHRAFGLVALVLLIGCASAPEIRVASEAPRYDIRLADYDGDGTMDVYSIRSERCEKYVNACPGERRYVHYVIITRGGSNGNDILRKIEWAADHPITNTGWVNETGSLAVRINGKWEPVPWTAPKGAHD